MSKEDVRRGRPAIIQSKSWFDKTVCRIREARTDRILKKRLWTMKERQEKDTKMGNNVVYALRKMSFGS